MLLATLTLLLGLAAISLTKWVRQGREGESPEPEDFADLVHRFVEQRRFMEALVVAKKARKAHPDDLGAALLLVDVYRSWGKADEAREALAEVQKRWPESSEVVSRRRQGAP